MAADKPWNMAASLGVQKAGLRNLVHSLDTTLAPDGIRAVSVTVRGSLGKDGPFTPERVGEAIYEAAARTRTTGAPSAVHRLTDLFGACRTSCRSPRGWCECRLARRHTVQ